jgi:hypothetical protein
MPFQDALFGIPRVITVPFEYQLMLLPPVI